MILFAFQSTISILVSQPITTIIIQNQAYHTTAKCEKNLSNPETLFRLCKHCLHKNDVGKLLRNKVMFSINHKHNWSFDALIDHIKVHRGFLIILCCQQACIAQVCLGPTPSHKQTVEQRAIIIFTNQQAPRQPTASCVIVTPARTPK